MINEPPTPKYKIGDLVIIPLGEYAIIIEKQMIRATLASTLKNYEWKYRWEYRVFRQLSQNKEYYLEDEICRAE